MKVRSIAAVLLVVVAGSAVAVSALGAERQATSVDPKLLVLRLSDLPKGYVVQRAAYVSNAQADRNAKDPQCSTRLRLSAEVQRIDGYNVSFTLGSGLGALLESSASVHRSAVGARDAVASFGRVFATCRGVKIHRAPLGSLGQQSELWTGTATGGGSAAQLGFVIWRWHERVGMLFTAGLVGIDQRRLVRLAAKQEARIEAASGSRR
jgi:hypothetical protein